MFKSYDFRFNALSGPGAKAFAVAIIDDVFEVDGFKIMETNGRLWVAFPQEKSTKVDDAGKAVYYKRVRFIDQKDNEEDKITPAEKEFCDAMLEAYSQFTQPAAKPATKNQAPSNSGKPDVESARAAMTRKRPLY